MPIFKVSDYDSLFPDGGPAKEWEEGTVENEAETAAGEGETSESPDEEPGE